MRTNQRSRYLLATVALAAAFTTGACASGGSDDSGGSRAEPAIAGDHKRADAGGAMAPEAAQDGGVVDKAAAQEVTGPQQPAIIATGTVSLEADDVAAARLDVQKIVDRYRGTVTQQETTTDDDGDLATARIVLRVPSDRFDEAVSEFEKVATLTGSTTGSEDVTTEVIDVDARVRAAEKSVRRIEALLAQATDLRQVISIESELSQRQADLDSLKSRQQWLADQTSLSTITVYLEQTSPPEKEEPDGSGFLGGLAQGWDSFLGGLVVALTVLGFLVPWLVAAALVVVPLMVWVRRSRRGRPAPAAPDPTT